MGKEYKLAESGLERAPSAAIDNLALVSRTDEVALLALILQFSPLIMRCSTQASQILKYESLDVVRAEVRFLFLQLLNEWNPERTNSFTLYIACQLPQRVRNWLRDEQRSFDRCRSMAYEHEITACFDDLVEPEPEPGQIVVLLSWQNQSLEMLPEKQRCVIELVIGGYSEREIAARLHITQQRVNTLKHAAQKKIKEFWEKSL